MANPALSINENKKLGKKKKSKLAAKSILASPYAEYWPLLPENLFKNMRKSLEDNLTRIVPEKINVQWSLLKDLPREERREFRQKQREKTVPRGDLVMGINDVTKSLENDEICSVLISSDVKPKLLVQHVLDLAVLRTCPVLVIRDLKCITKEKIGVKCCVIAFKKGLKTSSPYGCINRKIREYYKRIPGPENHINESRINGTLVQIDDDDDDKEDKKEEIIENPIAKVLHVDKRSDNTRVFVPPLSSGSAKRKSEESKGLDFLQFEEDGPDIDAPIIIESTPQKTLVKRPKVSYKSLLLRKVVGNPERIDKKIEELKKN